MRCIRTLLYIAAADVLALFIGLTLAGSSNPLIRVISAVCGTGIMVCLIASFALRTSYSDLKNERVTGKKTAFAAPAGMAATASLPGLVSWLVLRVTAGSSFDFYRWHKLINGWFLQVFNLIEPDASSSALTDGQIWAMLPLALVPGAVFAAAYLLGYKGAIKQEK